MLRLPREQVGIHSCRGFLFSLWIDSTSYSPVCLFQAFLIFSVPRPQYYPKLCGWGKCLMLYKESKISDINCLHLPMLCLTHLRIVHPPGFLWFPSHRREEVTPLRLSPTVLSSQASVRTWLHPLFLPAASSLPGMIMFKSPMTPFVSSPDFLKTQYPLTTANSVHFNISSSAWCLGAGPPGLLFHSRFMWMLSCSSLSYMFKASHFSLIPPPLSKQQ